MSRDNQTRVDELKAAAVAKCEGCRLSWRLVKGGAFRHRPPLDMACDAQEERQALRDMSDQLNPRNNQAAS